MSDTRLDSTATPIDQTQVPIDASSLVTNTDYSNFQTAKNNNWDNVKNNGSDVLPGLSITTELKAEALGNEIDQAIASGDKAQIAKAEADVGSFAGLVNQASGGSADVLKQFADAVSDNVQTKNTGIQLDAHGNEITTHIVEQLSDSQYSAARAQHDDSVRHDPELGNVKDLVGPLTTDQDFGGTVRFDGPAHGSGHKGHSGSRGHSDGQTSAAVNPGDSQAGNAGADQGDQQVARIHRPNLETSAETSTPAKLGHDLDHALASNDPRELARAEQNITARAAEVVRNSAHPTEDLNNFWQELNKNINTPDKGVVIENNGKTLTTHVVQQFDIGGAIKEAEQGASIYHDKSTNTFLKDLAPPLTVDLHSDVPAGHSTAMHPHQNGNNEIATKPPTAESQQPEIHKPIISDAQPPQHALVLEGDKTGKHADASDRRHAEKATNDLNDRVSPVLGTMVDKALETHSPQELQKVAEAISRQAAETLKNSPNPQASLQHLEDQINKSVQTQNTGVEFEIRGNQVITHISKNISQAEAAAASNSGDTSVRQDAKYGPVQDLIPPVASAKVGDNHPQAASQQLAKVGDNHSQPASQPAESAVHTGTRPVDLAAAKPADAKPAEAPAHALPERNEHQAASGHGVENAAHRQSLNLNLSAESEHKLEHALTMATAGPNAQSMEQLQHMLPELANPSSSLGLAFKNAMQEMGYDTKLSKTEDGNINLDVKPHHNPNPQTYMHVSSNAQGGHASAAQPAAGQHQAHVDQADHHQVGNVTADALNHAKVSYNGNLETIQVKHTDGSDWTLKMDVNSHKILEQDAKFQDGSSFSKYFDKNTGAETLSVTHHTDGTTTGVAFGPAGWELKSTVDQAGHVKDVEMYSPLGHISENFDYDQKTGAMDRAAVRTYDSQGAEVTADYQYSNGSHVHRDLDTQTHVVTRETLTDVHGNGTISAFDRHSGVNTSTEQLVNGQIAGNTPGGSWAAFEGQGTAAAQVPDGGGQASGRGSAWTSFEGNATVTGAASDQNVAAPVKQEAAAQQAEADTVEAKVDKVVQDMSARYSPDQQERVREDLQDALKSGANLDQLVEKVNEKLDAQTPEGHILPSLKVAGDDHHGHETVSYSQGIGGTNFDVSGTNVHGRDGQAQATHLESASAPESAPISQVESQPAPSERPSDLPGVEQVKPASQLGQEWDKAYDSGNFTQVDQDMKAAINEAYKENGTAGVNNLEDEINHASKAFESGPAFEVDGDQVTIHNDHRINAKASFDVAMMSDQERAKAGIKHDTTLGYYKELDSTTFTLDSSNQASHVHHDAQAVQHDAPQHHAEAVSDIREAKVDQVVQDMSAKFSPEQQEKVRKDLQEALKNGANLEQLVAEVNAKLKAQTATGHILPGLKLTTDENDGTESLDYSQGIGGTSFIVKGSDVQRTGVTLRGIR